MSLEQASKPVVLVVDDQPDDARSGLVLRLGDRASVKVLHPAEVHDENLAEADLVLMDYKLDIWPERDNQSSASFNIQSGLALATVFREVADKMAPDRLTGIALHTAHLLEASGRIRPPHSKHVVARLNNLEWVFEKTSESTGPDPYSQVVELASAVQQLHGDWPAEAPASRARACELLNLREEVPWFSRSWLEVRECQPPIDDLGALLSQQCRIESI